MSWQFEGFELDEERFELRRDGAALHLEPKLLDLLFYLARNRDRTVSKDELFEAVWHGTAVVDSALTRAVSVLRTALGDTGRAQRMILTVPGRGYRFAAMVRELGTESSDAILSRPALAVLPFANLNGGPDQEYFADGITEALITALAYWRRFPVIARNAAFAYKAQRPALGQIGRALGCRYLLEGELEERAISLNPSGARSYHFLGCVLEYAGRPVEAIEKLKTALRLDPYFRPAALILSDLALSHLLGRQLDDAISLARRATREAPGNPRPLQRLVSALGNAGREEEAAVALAELLRIQPDFSFDYVNATYPFKNPEDRQFFVEGLRRAGFRE